MRIQNLFLPVGVSNLRLPVVADMKKTSMTDNQKINRKKSCFSLETHNGQTD